MEAASYGKGAWIEAFFDPGHPNLYLVTIPVLTLFALGVRRGAIVYLLLLLGFMALSGRI
ncbi:MAG: hypothetical protein ACFBWO_05550 [Paracoccaceae bacterium]